MELFHATLVARHNLPLATTAKEAFSAPLTSNKQSGCPRERDEMGGFRVYWGKREPQGKVVADGGAEGWQGGERQLLRRCVRRKLESGSRTAAGWEVGGCGAGASTFGSGAAPPTPTHPHGDHLCSPLCAASLQVLLGAGAAPRLDAHVVLRSHSSDRDRHALPAARPKGDDPPTPITPRLKNSSFFSLISV